MKEIRHRSRAHRRFVASLCCVVCRRQPPSDPHHLKFAQPRAKGLKSGDQWCVPLCRIHHDQVELAGDEAAWWQVKAIDPQPLAVELWAISETEGRV